MAHSNIESNVESAIQAVTGDNLEVEPVGTSILSWLVRTGESVPPWWSRVRDTRLSQLSKVNNYLATAIYNSQAKMTGVGFRVVARNRAITAHVDQAEELTHLYSIGSEFGKTFMVAYAKFIEDVLTQDNGGFMEIIGDGEPDGPIIGTPITIRHLDSRKCTRTRNPIYPVLYLADDGRQYKFHWTRVIAISQMPSSRYEMNGVGFCAVSRAVEVAITMDDILRYKQERLGSRPHNQMLVGKGITAKQIQMALRQVEEELANRGFSRYARTVAIGSESTEINIEKIDLAHENPFNEVDSVNLGMYAIAAAFGMESDELWPTGAKAGSSTDANLRRMRSRGKFPAQLTAELGLNLEFKLVPAHLSIAWNFADDEEDQQRALIRDIRGRNRERDLGTGAIDVRTSRILMLKDGDIDRRTFEVMEMSDGRLADGTSISMLFFDGDPVYSRSLGSIDNDVLVVSADRAVPMIEKIQRRRQDVLREIASTASQAKRDKLDRSFHALDWLEDQYKVAAGLVLPNVPQQQRRMRIDTRLEPGNPEMQVVNVASPKEDV